MKKRKILIVVDPHHNVPPQKYGGTERMVNYLCKGICDTYRIGLIAKVGSKNYGGKNYRNVSWGDKFLARFLQKLYFQFMSLYACLGCDLIISAGRSDYLYSILTLTRKKVIFWYHFPIPQEEIDWILSKRSNNIRFVGISHSQVNSIRQKQLFSVVYNGVDLSKLRFNLTPLDQDSYLAFVGILSKNKGAHIAIQVAIKTNKRLKMAGKIPTDAPEQYDFFKRDIKPFFDHPLVEYVGLITDKEKSDFYGKAEATLFPITADEAFGLVMIESMACGTPVIAKNMASVPEIIRHGYNGFICDSLVAFEAATKKIDEIDRKDCRRSVEDEFAVEVMQQKYLKIIEKLIDE